jgi:hypothetical protein
LDQPFGNAGRNIARSDSFFQFDLGVHKQFRLPINEKRGLNCAPNSLICSIGRISKPQIQTSTARLSEQFAARFRHVKFSSP